jgi:hypothetical protein
MGSFTNASTRSLLLFMVLLVAIVPMTIPVHAVRKGPPNIPTCFEVIGRAPNGTTYYASFYRRWMANKQAAAWAAAGWTNIFVGSC